MRQTPRYLCLITAAALLVTACATTRVSSHVERGLDFTRYRTFDWGPADALPTGDPRVDTDPLFQDRVQGAIERAMAARGFARAATSEVPDLRIHYHASIDRRIDVSQADDRIGLAGGDRGPGIVEYESGTLVVDVVETRSNRVIWRGWAQDSVAGVFGDKDDRGRRIDDDVARMFRRLPAAR